MKTKFLKVSLLILAFSLVLGATVATVISANETETTKTPEIISQNVSYSEKFALMYAVKADTVTNPANLKLLVYDQDPKDGGVQPIRAYTEFVLTVADPAVNNLEADSYVFTTDGIAATSLTQVLYIQAACGDAKSEIKRYSMAEYLYERLESNDATLDQKAFYNATINFGASTQQIVAKETNLDNLITNYRYVTVEGGTVDGYKSGVYKIGTALNAVKDVPENAEQWSFVSYDKGGASVIIKTDGAFVVANSKNWLTLDAVKAHRIGSHDFEDYTAGDEVPSTYFSLSNATNLSKSFVEDESQGTVAKLTTTKHGDYINLKTLDTGITAEEATAYEISFDIRFDTAMVNENEPIEIRFMNNGTALSRTNIYSGTGNANNIYVSSGNGSSNCAGKKSHVGTVHEWFNVRAVMYKGDSNIYFYINGSTEPMIEYGTASGKSNKGDISNITGCRFLIYSAETPQVNAISEIYVDNYFCGYTKEVNPFATPAVTE